MAELILRKRIMLEVERVIDVESIQELDDAEYAFLDSTGGFYEDVQEYIDGWGLELYDYDLGFITHYSTDGKELGLHDIDDMLPPESGVGNELLG